MLINTIGSGGGDNLQDAIPFDAKWKFYDASGGERTNDQKIADGLTIKYVGSYNRDSNGNYQTNVDTTLIITGSGSIYSNAEMHLKKMNGKSVSITVPKYTVFTIYNSAEFEVDNDISRAYYSDGPKSGTVNFSGVLYR